PVRGPAHRRSRDRRRLPRPRAGWLRRGAASALPRPGPRLGAQRPDRRTSGRWHAATPPQRPDGPGPDQCAEPGPRFGAAPHASPACGPAVTLRRAPPVTGARISTTLIGRAGQPAHTPSAAAPTQASTITTA